MKIVTLIKLVPDLVEELSIAPDGSSLDPTWLRMIINEFDDHAIEQAILLKERNSAEIIVIAPETEGIDEVLFTAIAKGADQVIKMKGDFANVNNHALAHAAVPLIESIRPDLIFTGVQANNDMDGSVGPILAACLNMPFVGYISGVTLNGIDVIVNKEYPGGVIAEMEIKLPAVLGIQSADQPPRYVAVSKVRQVMKTSNIIENTISALENSGGPQIDRMFQPETSSHAEMITGEISEVADRLVKVFKEIGIL
jgi:electron transfer flavoprotein beta subunit